MVLLYLCFCGGMVVFLGLYFCVFVVRAVVFLCFVGGVVVFL